MEVLEKLFFENLEKNDLLQQLDSERNGSAEAQERYARLGK